MPTVLIVFMVIGLVAILAFIIYRAYLGLTSTNDKQKSFENFVINQNKMFAEKEKPMKKFVYKDNTGVFFGKKYYYNSGAFLDENKKKLDPIEEGEVSKAYFAGLIEFIDEIQPIVANERVFYGSAAYDIYVRMCDRFGWYMFQKGNFARQKKLYAKPATPEGYAVHFISHSNWTSTVGGVWRNKIYFGDRIEESWPIQTFYSPEHTHSMDEIRVVFARKNREYVFIGVYKVEKWEEVYDAFYNGRRMLKTYKLISKTYPIEN